MRTIFWVSFFLFGVGFFSYSQDTQFIDLKKDPYSFYDAAAKGETIYVERDDGSTFKSSTDTKIIWLDANGNEITYEKFKEFHKANAFRYTMPWRVVNEDLVFRLKEVRRDEKELLGLTLETITYPDINGKETIIPDNEQDMLLCFWGLGCRPCIQELQILNGIAGDFPELKIVALSSDKLAEVKEFVENEKYKWRNIAVIPEYKEEYMPTIQNKVIPTCVLISKEGIIRNVFYGTTRQTIVDLDAYFKE